MPEKIRDLESRKWEKRRVSNLSRLFLFLLCVTRDREREAATTIPAKWYSATQIWVSDFMYIDFVQNDLI